MSEKQIPSDIQLHRLSGRLSLTYPDGGVHELEAELLRVYSPSAEVKGHGTGQEILQTGKKHVQITGLEPVGNYAIKLIFDDGHDSGIYTWDYLYALGHNKAAHWQAYQERMNHAGASRDPSVSAVRLME